MFLEKSRSPLFAVIAIEILGVALMMLGVIPREASLFLLGIFVYFALFAPLKQAVLFAVFSIPLYTALPITDTFDSMAAWRIIVAVLFLRFFDYEIRKAYEYTKTQRTSVLSYIRNKFVFSSPLMLLTVLFFGLAMLSLFVAQEPIFGIKKLLYLANIFLLFFVIREVVRSKEDFIDVLKYTFAGSAFALAAAYAQFITILFVPLYAFWQWWAANVIPVFYGANLGELLSYSNTWFSYYEEAEATLRTFSIFPDSHSFALSMVLALPMALAFFVASGRRGIAEYWPVLGNAGYWPVPGKIFFGSFAVLALLAIIFSGTRGVWVGAIPVFLAMVAILNFRGLFLRSFSAACGGLRGSAWAKHAIPGLKSAQEQSSEILLRTVLKISITSFLLFALLFPVSSQLLRFSQIRQGGIASGDATFERVSSSFSMRELSNLGRIQIWKSTLESIAARPFLGVGIGNYPVVLNENVSATKEGASAHSLYLDFAAETGVLGGILVLLIFLAILSRAVAGVFRNKDVLISAFAGFFAIYLLWVMAYSAVDVVLLNDKVLLLFTALTALIYARIYNNRGEERGK